MSPSRILFLIPALAVAVAACNRTPPKLVSYSIAQGPRGQLSTVATYQAQNVTCARLTWTSDSDGAGSTACAAASGAIGQVVALGLKPATSYDVTLELHSLSGITTSEPVAYTSPDLPDDLKALGIAVTGQATAGLTLTGVSLGANSYVIAFDGSGSIRWYQNLGASAWIDAQQVASGDFTVFSGTSTGWVATEGSFVEMLPTGEAVASYAVDLPDYLDPHELRVTYDANGVATFHYFTYVIEPYDLTSVGGTATSPLAMHSLVRQRLGEPRQVIWDAHGRVELSDRIEGPSPLTFGDLVHPNSIDFDLDGNYVVSMRNLGEVQKIDAQTGATIWRLGGVHNQFTFVGDPLGGFSAQHSARVLPNGNILIYDNGWRHSPWQTRAVEYALDLDKKTATLVWEYRHGPEVFTPFMGSVQRLSSGATQVGFSQAGLVDEVDAQGNLVWEARLTNGNAPAVFYRALRIAALDEYRQP